MDLCGLRPHNLFWLQSDWLGTLSYPVHVTERFIRSLMLDPVNQDVFVMTTYHVSEHSNTPAYVVHRLSHFPPQRFRWAHYLFLVFDPKIFRRGFCRSCPFWQDWVRKLLCLQLLANRILAVLTLSRDFE